LFYDGFKGSTQNQPTHPTPHNNQDTTKGLHLRGGEGGGGGVTRVIGGGVRVRIGCMEVGLGVWK